MARDSPACGSTSPCALWNTNEPAGSSSKPSRLEHGANEMPRSSDGAGRRVPRRYAVRLVGHADTIARVADLIDPFGRPPSAPTDALIPFSTDRRPQWLLPQVLDGGWAASSFSSSSGSRSRSGRPGSLPARGTASSSSSSSASCSSRFADRGVPGSRPQAGLTASRGGLRSLWSRLMGSRVEIGDPHPQFPAALNAPAYTMIRRAARASQPRRSATCAARPPRGLARRAGRERAAAISPLAAS